MPPDVPADRQPPQDIEAEVCLLGSLLLDNNAVDAVVQVLDREAFYRPAHQEIFEVMVRLHDERKPIDIVILRDELSRRGMLDKVGGVDYLASLTDSVPSAANAEAYAKIVKDKASLRGLMNACYNILRDAGQGQGDVDALLDRSERSIFEVVKRKDRTEPMKIEEVLREAFRQLHDARDARERGNRLTGLPTGFFELDELISGMQPSQLMIIAGRPSMGKTSFALRILEQVGVEERRPCLLFSMEMDARTIALNMVCSRARISSHSLRKGLISEGDFAQLMLAAGSFSEAPIFIDDSSALSILDLRARARRLQSSQDIQLVVVDYLQLMESKSAESREREVAMISRSLKSLARELSAPVIALAQLSRAPEAREDRRPRLSDLRESGSIEQDADVVMLLYREEYYVPNTRPGLADVIIAKQRNGPVGSVEVAFLKDFARFENLSTRPGP
ncbi:MAG: replicative DNA helicase [Planctomycetes bacterium]|nr:replicative DNA helicase [Planctomycetota bacterium]